ncbi:MAG: MBL fold metallo-hydrolase [Bacteroidales bacterium]|nr:MBL fold metallo-hydrolase [Bacteroidales bacterium]
MLIIHRIINIPVPSNSYVIFDKAAGRDCIIIDPGTKNNEELIEFLGKENLVPRFIVLTHEHFDHCWGVNHLLEQYQAPIICSQSCSEAIKSAKRNCSVFYDNRGAFVIISYTLTVERLNFTLNMWGKNVKFYLTPGHTEASICFKIDRYLFTGDTLIKNEKTVTKLPTGSVEKLKESIGLLTGLQGSKLVVYPGHGESFDLNEYDLSISLNGIINV